MQGVPWCSAGQHSEPGGPTGPLRTSTPSPSTPTSLFRSTMVCTGGNNSVALATHHKSEEHDGFDPVRPTDATSPPTPSSPTYSLTPNSIPHPPPGRKVSRAIEPTRPATATDFQLRSGRSWSHHPSGPPVTLDSLRCSEYFNANKPRPIPGACHFPTSSSRETLKELRQLCISCFQ